MAKILIAEDEPDIRDLITFTLQFAGHQVTATANGEEACRKAVEVLPDLILLDVRMPRMTGYEACQAIKQVHPEIKIIMLTSYEEDEMLFSALRAGETARWVAISASNLAVASVVRRLREGSKARAAWVSRP